MYALLEGKNIIQMFLYNRPNASRDLVHEGSGCENLLG